MTALCPLFVAGAAEKVAAIAVKCLAVAGGFLAGYILGGVAAWALDRWVFAHKAPEVAKKLCKLLLGIAIAVLVALIVFGDGSGGGLFGGGTGEGTSKGADSSAANADGRPAIPAVEPVAPKAQHTKAEPIRTPEVRPSDVVVRITFLGGADVSGERFYLTDDDAAPKTFDEVKAAVVKKKDSTAQKVYLAVQFPAKNRIAEDSLNVTQVTDWARNTMGIEVLWPGKN